MNERSQIVEDLLWVVNSPSLIDDAEVVSLKSGDIDADELKRFLDERPGHRVGRYFENLVAFWLDRIVGVEMVAAGEQVWEGTRTVGEIDFVFRTNSSTLVHWETAVKFFLHCPNDGDSDFPGPNASDNFERKMTKLFEKQLPLSDRVYPDVVQRRAFVRGRMFYHPSVGEPELFPDRLAPNHLRGTWIRESELDWFDEFESSRGLIVMKPYWLATPVDQTSRVPVSELCDQLGAHFRCSRNPALVAVEGAGYVFVVPETWPVVER